MKKIFVGMAAICAVGCQPPDAPAPAAIAPKTEGFSTLVIAPKTMTELAAEIAAKSITAEAATQGYLDRIAAVDDAGPLLNAVLAVNPAAISNAKALDAAAAPKGPLHGVPILLKDNIDTEDMPTTAGSMALKANATGRDSPLVARLRAAGAIIIGKTNLSEWANFRSGASTSGWSGVGGQTKNPHVLDRNPCGSSSGSGSAVAAGLAAAAIGTETDGSIICPSAVNGIVGIKPTVGLVPRTHIVPISSTQDTAGPMALTVADAAAILTVIAGSDADDPASAEADARKTDYSKALDENALQGKRIGVARYLAGYHRGTDVVFERALEDLKAAGAELVELKEPPGRQEMNAAEFTVLLAEFKAGLNAYLASTPATVKPRTLDDLISFNIADPLEMEYFDQSIFEQAAKAPALTDKAYLDAKATAARLAGKDGIDKLVTDNNIVAIVAPSGGPAWTTDLVTGDHFLGASYSMAAIAGYPSITVPMGNVHDLPLGLCFFGPKWSESALIGLAYAYEQKTKALTTPKFLARSP